MSCEICGKTFPKGKDMDEMCDLGWSFFFLGVPKKCEIAFCPDHNSKEKGEIVFNDILGWKK